MHKWIIAVAVSFITALFVGIAIGRYHYEHVTMENIEVENSDVIAEEENDEFLKLKETLLPIASMRGDLSISSFNQVSRDISLLVNKTGISPENVRDILYYATTANKGKNTEAAMTVALSISKLFIALGLNNSSDIKDVPGFFKQLNASAEEAQLEICNKLFAGINSPGVIGDNGELLANFIPLAKTLILRGFTFEKLLAQYCAITASGEFNPSDAAEGMLEAINFVTGH